MMKNTLRILGVLMLLGATTFAGTISITNANFSDVTANGCGMGYVYQVGVGSAPCNLLPYPQQNLNGVSGIGWTFGQPPEGGGGDGLATGNSAFNPPQLPTGVTQVAFLQNGGNISQLLSGFTAGQKYTLDFYLGERGGMGNQTVEALITDGQHQYSIGSWNLGYSNSFVLEAKTFTLPSNFVSGNETLMFLGESTGDSTAFISSVGVTYTPEPVTLVLFGSGLVGIGGVMRRRLIG